MLLAGTIQRIQQRNSPKVCTARGGGPAVLGWQGDGGFGTQMSVPQAAEGKGSGLAPHTSHSVRG